MINYYKAYNYVVKHNSLPVFLVTALTLDDVTIPLLVMVDTLQVYSLNGINPNSVTEKVVSDTLPVFVYDTLIPIHV